MNNLKILMIDDEPEVCTWVEDFFKKRGVPFVSVYDPGKAMSVISKEQPTIIFLDILMGKTNGLDLLKKIKKKYKNALRVFILSVEGSQSVKDQAMKLGADDYIEKPFDNTYLETVVIKKVIELKPKILIVDDEEEVTNALAGMVKRKLNCEVTTAMNGQTAIEKMKDNDYDLVLLDLKMPDKNGNQVMEEVAKVKELPDILIITAYDESEDLKKMLREGAVDYLPKGSVITHIKKPIADFEMLFSKIKVILGEKGKYLAASG